MKKIILKLAIILFILTLTINENVYADSLISESSFFNKLSSFAVGLVDGVKSFDSPAKTFNINNLQDGLTVLDVSFRNSTIVGSQVSEFTDFSQDDDVEPTILNVPLVYPNPFRQSSSSGAILAYDLSKDFDIEIHIYNMLAQRVFKQTFLKGSIGARKGSNRMSINQDSLGGILMSSGVYFYVFVHNGSVVGKGKMVVKP